MQKVRIHFSKTGRAKYISHLDLMRTFMRAVKRSGLKIKYTEGFNPHPHMAFGNPLSLGYESVAELCEVRFMDDDADLGKAAADLDEQMPEGIKIREIAPVVEDFKQIGFSRYRITIEKKEPFTEADESRVRELFSGEKLEITKKSKSYERVTDILLLISDFECGCVDGKLIINATVAFNNTVSLNPDHIVRAIAEKTDVLGSEYHAAYMKTNTFDYEMKDFR